MNVKRLYEIIQGPITTEKSVQAGEQHNQVMMKVALNANKAEIEMAIKTLFKVEVLKVRTVRLKGKIKRFRQVLGRRSDVKKAYVSLSPGHDINFADFN